MIAYADSSALVKLVLAEQESAALRDALLEFDAVVSSELAVVEVGRATRRAGGARAGERGAVVLDAVALLRLDRMVLDRAAALAPSTLRSLDAIHLATALELGGPVRFVAYDERLLEAATMLGLATASPL
jgi:predicted nucleic acid-binding protein